MYLHTLILVRRLLMEELNPELFTWDNYEPDYGARLNLDYRQSIDYNIIRREIKNRCIGYCDGGRLYVRPRSDCCGVMLEDDDGAWFWFHFPKNALNQMIGKDR